MPRLFPACRNMDGRPNGLAAELPSVLLGQFLSPCCRSTPTLHWRPCSAGPFEFSNSKLSRAPDIHQSNPSATSQRILYLVVHEPNEQGRAGRQAAFQDTWPRVPESQTRGCTKPLSCLWSPATRTPKHLLPVPRDTKTRLAVLLKARSSSGVRVEKGRPSNATHPRTHFPLLALFGYPSILRVSLAQTSRCLCCSALGRNWPPSRFWRVSTAREQRQPMSFPSCRPVTLSPPPDY